MRRAIALAATLLACGGADPAPRSASAPAARAEAKPAAKAAARPDAPALPAEAARPTPGAPKLVLLIVMDTVRADHLSMCGYERPTTPYLELLTRRADVSYTCDAHSPAPWTVPSHASYFTGLPVPEHGSDTMGIRFSSSIPTISEIMAKQGYQTALFSANPTLSNESGLQRGFQFVEVGRTLTDVRGDEVRRRMNHLLETVSTKTPLFLVVNLIDAHDPYPRIPPDVGWVPAQPTMTYDVHDPERDTPYHKYFQGGMTQEEQQAFETRAKNGYDYGLSQVDQNVEGVLRLLRQDGWMSDGFRVVITSDHGEYLGEHHLLRHGSFLWEPVTRVPFLYLDSARATPLPLTAPFSSLHAFSLLTTGALPAEPLPTSSFANQREYDVKAGADVVALWTSPTDKILWQNDRYMRVDLSADPGEATPGPLAADHPRRPQLEGLVAAHQRHLVEVRAQELNPALTDQLTALGYIETPKPSPAAAPPAQTP